MSTSQKVPYKEYPSILQRYSEDNQIMASNYKNIIQSETRQAYNSRKFNTVGDAMKGPLNVNIPVSDKKELIFINNKPINVYKQFWSYKQPGGIIFTDWKSSGISGIETDISIRNLPLKSAGGLINPNVVLGNTNNVRNSLQNYGKEFLLTTNMLNTEAFKNGVNVGDGNINPYRGSGGMQELDRIEHSNFENAEDGDTMTRMKNKLRVDLPPNYSNNSLTTWQFINPICIKPRDENEYLTDYSGNSIKSPLDFNQRLRWGTFNVNILKYIGDSCLTENYGVIPTFKSGPVDVFSDNNLYPPLSCPNYYNSNYSKDDTPECEYILDGLYCSKNANYAAMPVNYYFKNLDTSFDISPDGSNSLTLGTTVSKALKHFINNDLHDLNTILIIRKLAEQINKKSIDEKTPEMLRKLSDLHKHHDILSKSVGMNVKLDDYNQNSENDKYTHLFQVQQFFHQKYHMTQTVIMFIVSLNIYKFGGNQTNFQNVNSEVVYTDNYGNVVKDTITEPGMFLVLPSMLHEDVFVMNKDTTGTCDNSTDCCFRGPAEAWTNDKEYTPVKMNGEVNNLDNMVNPACGTNPYNAPDTF